MDNESVGLPKGSTESSPLLGGQSRQPSHHASPSVKSVKDTDVLGADKSSRIVNLVCLIIFLAASAGGFLGIPQTRIMEDVLCHEYYDKTGSFDGPIDEQMCKLDSIQSELASILAIQVALDASISFVAAFPWSFVADRIGRKLVLGLNLTGMALGVLWTMLVLWFRDLFPVRLVWLESVSQLIGGGNPVLIGLLLSILADVSTEEKRGVIFLRMHVASLCGNLLAPSLSSLMMEQTGPWPPAWIGVSLLVASAICTFFVPETLKVEQTSELEHQEPSDDGSRMSHLIIRIKDSLSVLNSRSLMLLLIVCLGSLPIFHGTSSFMAQFISKRYNIKLFQSGYVQSAYGVAQMVQSLIVMPWLSRFLMASTTPRKVRWPDEHRRDLFIARCSYVITAVAALVLGFARTLRGFLVGLVLLALGSGCSSLTRSLMSLYVDPVHRSRLFGLVGMVEVVGAIYAQPMLAGLFSLGMKLGGGWIGLPYFGLTLLIAATTLLLLFVRVPKKLEAPPPALQHEDHTE